MHAHSHSHAYGPNLGRVLRLSLLATAAYIAVLVIAGVQARSLALLSEAGHNLSDFFALLLSWGAVRLSTRPPNQHKTYGYNRAGVLAAFLNALGLIAIAFYIFYEAGHRLLRPEQVQAEVVIWVSAAGVVLNGLIAWMLYRTGRDVNIRSALLHEIGDTLSTAAVVIGGIAIAFTGQQWIDPALSIGIGALILWSSLGIIRETLNILLEGAPRGVEIARIVEALQSVDGVNDVHDLHVWSIGSEQHALSCHISIQDIPPSASDRILREVNARLLDLFHIHHTTIQFEHAACQVAHGCVMPVSGQHSH